MLNESGEILYVGKARNVKKRVSNYFRSSGLLPKTQAMMLHVTDVEVIKTNTESEALLLENNLIKKHRPRYNVVLRDDKSYPYIRLDDTSDFPRLGFYRGNRSEPGRFFGPYANAGAVREILSQLQKIFPVRQCEDTFFKLRSRPCLQYQIKRCTAPCVGYIDKERYEKDVEQAELFLKGKSDSLNQYLMDAMEKASTRLDFEMAASYRDRIRSLNRIRETQIISGEEGDWDVIAMIVDQGIACVEVTFVRSGRHSGSKSFYPKINLEAKPQQIMSAFLGQFYLNKPIPSEILCDPEPLEKELLMEALSTKSKKQVYIQGKPRGRRVRLLRNARDNARIRLKQYLAGKASETERRENLQQNLDLQTTPEHIECFDASHTSGNQTVVSCVVFGTDGADKSAYRRYNIRADTQGDDYAALREALKRRYEKIKSGEGKLPDLIIIDGGKGQLGTARQVLEELQIDDVAIISVAKGSLRKPGLERIFTTDQPRAIHLQPHAPGFLFIQQIRDEAHRFAITGHRQRRSKIHVKSTLEEIPGIGAKRRQSLLQHFGGLQEVQRAGVDDLTRVPGVSLDLAKKIYNYFHDD